MIKKMISVLCILQFLTGALAFAAEEKIVLKDMALPSDFEGLKKEGGTFYYSPTNKGKVLIPVNVWGEVNRSGLHYVPVDTNIVQGLSLAGGPKSTASLQSVRLTRNVDGKVEEFKFDLAKGGGAEAFNTKLSPGDTVFVEKEFYYENRAYYTSLFGVFATILSSILLWRQVQRRP